LLVIGIKDLCDPSAIEFAGHPFDVSSLSALAFDADKFVLLEFFIRPLFVGFCFGKQVEEAVPPNSSVLLPSFAGFARQGQVSFG